MTNHTLDKSQDVELDAVHIEALKDQNTDEKHHDSAMAAEPIDGDDLPPGYYLSFRFLGTLAALCLSSCALYLYLLMPSAILTNINRDIGPSTMIAWWSIARTAAQSVTFTIIGRLSDIFGRRYFFIGGNAIALIGTIITATSFSITQFAVGAAVTGIGEAVQNSFTIALAELVKNKHRPLALSFIFATSAPFATFGAIMSTTMVGHGYSWRWCFYLPMICIGLALILLIFCYFPPDFKQLHSTESKTILTQLGELDYVGMLLFIAGLLLILLPLSWGGSLYPWNGAATISTLVIGIVLLIALGFWEVYSRQKAPLVYVQLFKNQGFLSLVACATTGSCIYYSSLILWPQQIANIFSISGSYAGWLACTVGGSTALGTIMAPIWLKIIGNSRIVMLVASAAMVAFIGGLAALQPGDLKLGIAFTILGPYFVGVVELTSLSLAPLFCKPEDLGQASGLLGTIRAGGASIAVAIYTTILRNRLGETIPATVSSIAATAGLSDSQIKNLLLAATTGTLGSVQGIPASVVSTVVQSLPYAYAAAFKTVFLSSLAFGGLAIVGALLTQNARPHLTNTVARRLNKVGGGTV